MFRSFFYAQFDCRFLVVIFPHAHAGKTRCTAIRRRLTGAHPHSRGENKQLLVTAASQRGSSPLIRGKRVDIPMERAHDRLIPAHAGKTTCCRRAKPLEWAHPRSREDNIFIVTPWGQGEGASLLTRGKQAHSLHEVVVRGLIPAHAGKTRGNRGARKGRRAHPRSRGENVLTQQTGYKETGSSPLTRGKRQQDRHRQAAPRLIPAHAGKTPRYSHAAPSCAAHPRSHGENTGWLSEGGHHYGSSPLTRGKHMRTLSLPTLARLIPAHARKTSCPDFSPSPTRAHPRPRRENRPLA